MVHLVAFHPDPTRLLLFSSAVDTSIRVWSLQDRSCLAVLTAHYSAVTSLSFSEGGHTMLSSGRDKICIVWDLQSYQTTRTVPVFESVEASVLLPEQPAPALGVKSSGLHFLTAGDQGVGAGHTWTRGWGKPVDLVLQQPLLSYRDPSCVGGCFWAVCIHPATNARPTAGTDPLYPGPCC